MNLKSGSLVALLFIFTGFAHGATSGQRLSIQVSPAMAFAPALLTIRTTLEPSDDNRRLEIAVDSPDYRRSTEIPLDGKNAQRVTIVELKNVPTGLYEVRAVLVGPGGPIATTMQLVKIEPSAGHAR